MSGSRTPAARTLAWVLGGGGALACALTLGWTVALGLYVPIAIVYLSLIVTGLLGALVASRKPDNSIGWLMCAGSLAGCLVFLPLDYGYAAQVIARGSWPLGRAALWLETWAYAPSLGMFYPMITVRFPDGRVPSRWRAVEWVAIAGTAAFAISVALAPAGVLGGFLPMSGGRLWHLVTPLIQNPLGAPVPEGLLGLLRLIGLVLIVVGYVGAAASLIDRFRHAHGDERLKLKWFAYAGVLMVLALLYGFTLGVVSAGVSRLVLGRSLGDALIPLCYASLALPVAIAIAILRYRLYDINLIINRSLVYGGMTAVVAAAYTASITLLQRVFISASGQKSDAAYVLTAFAIVVGFSPLKDWLQRQVDARLGGGIATSALDRFSSRVDAVVSVLDVERTTGALLDEAVRAFNAQGGAVYLHSSGESSPVCSRGHIDDRVGIEVPLRCEGRHVGRLVLGSRRGDMSYSERDRIILQRSADSAGEALALAAHLGFRPLALARGDAGRG